MSLSLRAIALILIATLLGGHSLDASAFSAAFGAADKSSDQVEGFLQIRATASNRGVTVEWHSGPERNILGFNIFRVSNGRRVQLNPGLIAGPVLITKGQRESYSWFDAAGTADSEYVVESIDLKGETAHTSSAKPVWQATLPNVQQSELLSNLGGASRDAGMQAGAAEIEQAKAGFQASADSSAPQAIADQWDIANQPALKIGIRGEGWYRISQSQMAAAGFDTTGDARNLRLFVAGSEIAIRVSRDAGSLGSSDFIEFWGQGLDTSTTDTQVYWLINGAQPGLRIATKGELKIESLPTPQTTSPQENATPFSPSWFTGFPGVIAQAVNPERSVGREITSPRIDEKKPNNPPSVFPVVTIDEAKRTDVPSQSNDSSPLASSPSDVATPEVVRAKAVKESKASVPLKAARSNRQRSTLRSAKSRRRRSSARLRRHNHVLAAAAVPAFTYSLQRKDHNIYYSAALNGERENFFGPIVFGNGPIVNLTLHNIETTAPTSAQLQVALQGVSFGTHQVRVFVNGSLLGSIIFADQTSASQTFTIPTSWLVDGDNALKLAPVTATNDTSIVEYVRITYPHSFRAENESLQFSIRSTQSARIEGFTTSNIRVLDITDPAAVEEVRPIVEPSGGGFAANIPSYGSGKARRIIALPSDRLSQTAWLTLNQPSTLNRSSNAANFVIIAHKDFIPALATLVAQRQAQGYTVAVANVEDVFDEFSYGAHTPQAIRDFMSLAKNSWTTAPSYLLLVGDASYDPRNYFGVGNFDFVPTKQVDTGTASTATALETASDDWLTDFNDDDIADISVGRLPVRTASEANLMISKIVNYSPANTSLSAMLVADTQGSYYFNFEAASDQVGALLPSTMAIEKVYRRLQPSDAQARANIIAKFNSGQTLTVYSGHGNVNIWGGQIFSSNDAVALTNGNRLPFVVVMDCLNGFFADPSLVSISEALLQAPNGGAVASFASSGLTIPDGQHEMGLRMFQLLYGGPSIPIGDASRQAKTATNDRDVRRTWILLGDPSMKIR
jgi:peptidase C25-like protein